MIYEGKVKLLIPSVYNFYKLTQFTKSLNRIKKLELESSGWSADEGYNIVISLLKPLDLIGVLNSLPIVEKSEDQGGGIAITLQTSARTQLAQEHSF